MQHSSQIPALQRQFMYPFIWRAFHELHPGTDFIPNWHIAALCKALEDVYDGRTTRLLITMPPRHLKSICTSVGFCAWALGKNPHHKIITASYGGRLAVEHTHNFRRLTETSWYQNLFHHMQIDPRHNRVSEMKTTSGGGRMAVAKGGSVTGFGADILIVDDLLKADDARSETERENAHAFFNATLLSRLDDKQNGRVIVIQQRLHEDDIAGRLISSGNYVHLNLPSIAEEPEVFDLGFGRTYERKVGDILFEAREPRETLARMRREMTPHTFNAQYQQNPTPPDGGYVQWEWFSRYDAPPERSNIIRVVQSWDTATSTEPGRDYSVGLTFGYSAGKWHLLDVFRRRVELPELRFHMCRLQKEWRADQVIVEDTNAGRSLLQDLRRQERGRAIYRAYKPRVGKDERLLGQTPKLSEGILALPEQASWLAAFKQELLGFPYARHDDQVDALAQFFDFISARRTGLHPDRERPSPRRKTGRRR